MPLRLQRIVTPAVVALAIGLAACASDDSTGTAETTTTPAKDPSAPAPETELDIEVLDGQVQPPPDRVNVDLGDRVRIVIVSDENDEAHLHGYDLSTDIGPAQDEVLQFTADQPGLFELETHDSGLLLTQLVVE